MKTTDLLPIPGVRYTVSSVKGGHVHVLPQGVGKQALVAFQQVITELRDHGYTIVNSHVSKDYSEDFTDTLTVALLITS